MLTYFIPNLDSAKLRDYNFIELLNLEILSVDLPYKYTCMFYFTINSKVLYIPPSFFAFDAPLVIRIGAIENIRNMHTVSINQITDVLPFNYKLK